MSGADIVVRDPGLSLLEDAAELSATGLRFTRDLTFDEWQEYGRRLQRVHGSILWWLGDWLRYGDRRYGEMYTQALDETEYAYQTLKQAAYMADRFEEKFRRLNLSWSHHQEVASLEPEEADALLDAAEEKGWSQKDLRNAVREYKRALAGKTPLPAGTYRVLYADPPWEYSQQVEGYGHTDKHYPTMPTKEIEALEVEEMAADDAVLFLWTTSPKLEEGLAVLGAWGFEYKAHLVWDKVLHNFGHYVSVRHELLLIGTRGSYTPTADQVKLHDSVQEIERTEHSRKPGAFRDIIDSMYPPGDERDRVELFARGDLPDHWEGHGDEWQPSEGFRAELGGDDA